MEASVLNEKETLASILELTEGGQESVELLQKLEKSVESCENTLTSVLMDYIDLKALELSTPYNSKLTKLEKEASRIIPEQTLKVIESSYRGYSDIIRNAPEEVLKKYPYKNISDTRELGRLVNGSHNVLQIKKMLDTQQRRESGLQDIMNYLYVLKAVDLVSF